MILGTHILFYSANPEADRAFFRDVLGLRSVDSGGGWLIFAMPPAEAGVHPLDGEFSQQHAGRRMMGAVIYLMCDDLRAEIESLEAKNVKCTKIEHDDWGMSTSIPLPSGSHVGLYQQRIRPRLILPGVEADNWTAARRIQPKGKTP